LCNFLLPFHTPNIGFFSAVSDLYGIFVCRIIHLKNLPSYCVMLICALVDAAVATSTLHFEGFVIGVAPDDQLEMRAVVEGAWVVGVVGGVGLLMLVARGDVVLVDLQAFLALMTGTVPCKLLLSSFFSQP
jgi:hypothetical protein